MLYDVTMITWKGGCIFVPLLAVSYAQEVCYVKASDGTYRKNYCEHNCCGITSSYCCREPGTADIGLIVGLVVGFVVLIAVIGGIVLYCLYRRRKARRQGQSVSTNSQEDVKSTGSADDTYPDKGYRDRGYPDRGYPDRGDPDKGYPDRGYPDRGHPDRGYPDRGYPAKPPPDPYYLPPIEMKRLPSPPHHHHHSRSSTHSVSSRPSSRTASTTVTDI